MDHIPRLSEILYVGLSCKIGTQTEVAIRRDIKDIEDIIMNAVYAVTKSVWMYSGSYREGFRLESSDRDVMTWPCNYKLITDISQARLYNATKHNIILIEDSDTPPGFVRLRVLTPIRNNMTPVLVSFNGGVYISSFLWRYNYFHSLANDSFFNQKNITIHGPCTNLLEGSTEYDNALCFATFYMPESLRGWIGRCQRHTWPPLPVLEKILRNGCHCVAIESKIVSPSNELEWRLSFSQAEHQLVCTMNHTQFLCYGLLKIFLKEVINNRRETVLCSYYMKTTMFWLMQLGHIRWCPNNLLDCFWKCFKYLIHCVYRGVFPNFFIPQNNMFINKIIGCTRDSLLEQLYKYCRMGLSCLLLSPTLGIILEIALSNPSIPVSTAC
ncbi:uncharacterized protein LOC133188274 [Saccostrea echinata]|uniref:uncharacterized protein LOC133188274 n=1 Tax=Saccostrea echinata TaxID=191078 RepID=UPI002A81DE7C|nr:uncharacterized protein LOC133188274 [Saccostrea echinata]